MEGSIYIYIYMYVYMYIYKYIICTAHTYTLERRHSILNRIYSLSVSSFSLAIYRYTTYTPGAEKQRERVSE